MSKKARSARGEIVDFDLLSIKQQLATTPVNNTVDSRRKFIDEKDRIQNKTEMQLEVPSALLMAAMSAEASAEANTDPVVTPTDRSPRAGRSK